VPAALLHEVQQNVKPFSNNLWNTTVQCPSLLTIKLAYCMRRYVTSQQVEIP